MIEESVKTALEFLNTKGLEGDAFGIRSRKVSYSIMNGEISDSTQYEDMGLGIRVLNNGRLGFGYCVPGKEEIGVKRALELSKLSRKMEISFPDENGTADVKTFDLKVKDAVEEGIGIDLAQNMIESAYSVDKDIIPTRGEMSLGYGTKIVGNTKGVFVAQDATIIGGAIAATIPGEKTSLMAGEGRSSRELDVNFEEVGLKAGEKVVSMKVKETIPAGDIPVVMSPDAIGMLLYFGLIPSFNGENVRKGKSVYQGRMNEKVAGEHTSIIDDPTSHWGIGSFPFDDEGVISSPVPLVEDGHLKNYLYDLKEAVNSDSKTTGNGVRASFKSPPQIGDRNIIIEGKDISYDSLVEDRVILVDGVMGAHTSNPASGDFSVVANPVWLVENGVKKGRLDGLMVSGNLPETLRTMELGDDYKKIYASIGSTAVKMELPSIKLTDVTISG
ncbi:MAG: TldD/PmbA family protein [Thermoplasmata archaeon]